MQLPRQLGDESRIGAFQVVGERGLWPNSSGMFCENHPPSSCASR
ncbi:hypothetical protein [Streptomyces sp. NPDC057494]